MCADQPAEMRFRMFWWFERRGELLRVEVLELAHQTYELKIIGADGAESTENFSNADDLAKRQEEVIARISKDGWSGPHGWLI
jgi:hypothetical protein